MKFKDHNLARIDGFKTKKGEPDKNNSKPTHIFSGNRAVRIPERGKVPAPAPKPVKKDS